MNKTRKLFWLSFFILLCCGSVAAKGVHHYVFFNRERARIHERAFLETKAFEGAQLKYTWRELEPEKDAYDFSAIRQDPKRYLTIHFKVF